MPELPEVETTRRGIAPWLVGRRVDAALVREPRLRWPLAANFCERVTGCRIEDVWRRAKYLLLELDRATLMVHLGMSGSLRIDKRAQPPRPHDHVELILEGGDRLRFHDPRRFGSMHLVSGDPLKHPLLADLGPEPLSIEFDGDLLYRASRQRRAPVKALIMDPRVVVGVGNIYASEALFLAGIHPARPARRISRERYHRLAATIREVLSDAIAMGGTTLRDFVNGNGEPGYFAQNLRVYARGGTECRVCGAAVRSRVIAQRNTFFCVNCQR